jgi:hypothetical protein
MIIPNKYSGYQAGIRLYPGGGGGGGGGGGTGGDPASIGDPGPGASADGGNPGAGGEGPNMPYSPPVTNTGAIGGNQITSWNATPVARQPIYQPQYMNYARPATQFDTSMYGTQPVQSPLSASGASRQSINNAIGNYFQQNPNSDINSTLAAMRGSGGNRTDIQTWGGVNNYGPSAQQPAQQTPFNPYTNNFGGFGGFGGRFMPQMQNPYSYQPVQQMQNPYSYQPVQQSYQPSYGPSQLPNYVSQTIKDLDQYQSQPVQAYQSPFARSSGPSQAIVGRSSQMRGTPNVMRRADGGIMSLMDDE